MKCGHDVQHVCHTVSTSQRVDIHVGTHVVILLIHNRGKQFMAEVHNL